MAIYYVWSGATGTGSGASWANAFTTLTTAYATEAAGDTIYVAHDHAESSASVSATSSGTLANPTKVLCVDRGGTVPPVLADKRATAQISTTTTGAISLAGCTLYDGIIFTAGAGGSAGSITIGAVNSTWTRFDNCSLRLGATGPGSATTLAFSGTTPGGTYCELNNTTMSFTNVGQNVQVFGNLRWRNTAAALLGTIPTLLFNLNSNRGSTLECAGVDFSAAGSGKTLLSYTSGTGVVIRFVDCKLHASVTKSIVPTAPGSFEADFIRCGASGNYAVHRFRYPGQMIDETTVVRTTGGASDGTTPLAWKIDTNANANFALPFETPPIAIWNDTTGSAVTATVEGIAAALPTDKEVWLDVQYSSDASSPQSAFISDNADILTTAANQTSSSETWGGSTAAFKLSVTFTPQMAGWVYARVKCA